MNAAGRGAFVVVAVLLALPAAAGIPEWAEATAKSAPQVPEGVPEWPERTLFQETHIVVAEGGTAWRVRQRSVIQMLSNRVDDFAFGSFAFNDTLKIKKAKGWHIPLGERAERNVGGALDLGFSDDFLTDSKARLVALHGVKKGSLVVYEFEAERHPYTQTISASFYDNAPVDLARWTVQLPAGWALKHAWLPEAGPEPTHEGSAWTFERRDLAPLRGEELGDAPADRGPRLVVALQPPAGASTASPAFADWSAVGRWYQDLAKGREAPSPEIQAAVKALLQTAGPEPLERIRVVTRFVRDRVRYLSRQVGIGGYQPHFAAQIYTDLYGDCKDKGTLLRAALAAAGFTSYPILINATNPYTVSPDVPALESFDHFIVGVAWPKDSPVPNEIASSTVDAGTGTILLTLDPTDSRAWPGSLPHNLAGKTGLAVIDGRGVLVTLPVGDPSWHRISCTDAVTIAADRSVVIRRVTRYDGAPAAEARHANAMSYKDRREAVENRIRSAWTGAEITDYAVTPEDVDGAYLEKVTINLAATAAALQENIYGLFAGATHDIDRVPLGKRKSAVQYPYPLQLRYESAVDGFAAETALPTGQSLAGNGWKVESAFDRRGDGIHGAWTATLSRTRFEPAAFTELKQFWSAAGKAAGPGLKIAP